LDCFIHQTYGRMRVRVATLKGNLQSCRSVMKELAALPGVNKVLANDVTGSIVVHYEPSKIHAACILGVFQKFKLLHNLIGFPNAQIKRGPKPGASFFHAEDWVSDSVEHASRILFKTLIEAAFQKTAQLLLRKILR
jgi:hypothetical protein